MLLNLKNNNNNNNVRNLEYLMDEVRECYKANFNQIRPVAVIIYNNNDDNA